MWLVAVVATVGLGSSSSTRVCSPQVEGAVLQEVASEASFLLTCTSSLRGRAGVLVALLPSPGLRLCVALGAAACAPQSAAVILNMTQERQEFTVRVAAEAEGVTCIKEVSTYMRAGQLFPQDTVEAAALLVGAMAPGREAEVVAIPGQYTKQVTVIEETDGEDNVAAEEAPMGEVEQVVMADSSIAGSFRHLEEQDWLWAEVVVLARAEVGGVEERGGKFSRIVMLLGLAAANWMVGTGIRWKVVAGLVDEMASSCRQCSCISHLLSLQAWKVGLLCSTLYPAAISFTCASVVFQAGAGCRRVVDLSRLGLFLLGTAPGNTSSIYFATLWNGDLGLSVALVLLSTVLSPLTSLLWWNTLGKVLLLDATTATLKVPIANIVEFVGVMIVPIAVGMYMGARLPALGTFLERVRKPVIVLGLLCMVLVLYFQYRHFFAIFGLSHAAAGAALAAGSFLLAGLTGYSCRLAPPEVASIAIDSCMRNATLAYAVIGGTFTTPSRHYVEIPANAQVLFTTVPIVAAWLAWQGGRCTAALVRGRGGAQAEVVVEEEQGREYPMVRISSIKEAWTDQDLRPLWC